MTTRYRIEILGEANTESDEHSRTYEADQLKIARATVDRLVSNGGKVTEAIFVGDQLLGVDLLVPPTKGLA